MKAVRRRNGAQILIDQLLVHGAHLGFGVPGESYLGVLDAMYGVGDQFRFVVCRHEAAASNMAEAVGKLTGTPGLCFATRGPGAAYDLYLTRNLKHAGLERVGSSPEAIALFKTGSIDAVAGVRQALVNASRGQPQFRVIPDRYTRIDQAVALPKGHPVASTYVRTLLEELKATGKIRAALNVAGQDGALVAPPAP